MKMTTTGLAGILIVAAAVSGCGLPREAGTLAAAQAAATLPADDVGVRAALAAQAAAWSRMAMLSGQREFGGIAATDPRFGQLCGQAAALAARDALLIQQGQDSVAEDRAALDAFRALWQQTNRYLNP